MKLDDIQLPDSLRDQLKSVERRLCRMETVIAICGGLLGFLITLLILYFSDRMIDTPVIARIVLAIVGAVGLAGFTFYWLRNWVWQRRNMPELCKLVQRKYPRLGDRLQGVVELTSGGPIPENTSPELCRAAVDQVAAESNQMNFNAAVSSKRPWYFAGAFVLFLGLLAALGFIYKDAFSNTVARYFNPNADRYTFTVLDLNDIPDPLVVPHGEDFQIAIRLDEKSAREPDSASANFVNQPLLESEFFEKAAVFDVPGQIQDGKLRIKAGDDRRTITVVPKTRPELAGLMANVALPNYLERDQESVKILGGQVTLLEGARMVFNGEVDRDISQVTMTEIDKAGEDGEVNKLDVRKSNFETPEYASDALEEARFNWKDKHGIEAASPYPLSVSTVKDKNPLIDLRGISRTEALLGNGVLKIDLSASDDYGLKNLRFNYEDIDNREKGLVDAYKDELVGSGSPTQQNLYASITFSPLIDDVPEGSTLKVYCTTRDYLPGRGTVTSAVYKVYVMNEAEHAEIMKEKVEGVLAKLDDLARDEEALIEENKMLQNGKPQDLQGMKGAKKLGEQELKEMKQADRLRKMSEEMKDILKESMKNKDIPEETMREWAEFQNDMKELSEGEMKEASEKLQQAGQKSEDKPRKKELGDAIEKQKEALKKLREMEKKANKSIENMLAKSFINRLKQRAKEEGQVAAFFKTEQAQEFFGERIDSLPDDFRDLIENLVNQQLETKKQSQNIQDDMQGFFNRTREEVYEKIHKEMVEKNTSVELEKIAKNNIAGNQAYKTIGNASKWKKQFEEWAGIIEEETKKEEQDGEPQDMDEELMEILLALMRARATEENIREVTRLVEDKRLMSKEDKGDTYWLNKFPKDVAELAKAQDELGTDIQKLEQRCRQNEKLADVAELVAKSSGLMLNTAQRLRNQKADQKTVAIETEIIEMLSQAASDTQSKMSGKGMPGLGMPGQNPGPNGNPMLQPSNMASEKAKGDGDGNRGGDRRVGRASGLSASDLPEEFRDLLETYLDSVEAPSN